MVETATINQALGKTSIEQMSRARQEPQWLLARRLEAFHMYEETALPAPNDELWRRTSLKDLRLEAARLFPAPPQLVASQQDPLASLPAALRVTAQSSPAGALVQHNSAGIYSRLADEYRRRGVVFCDLQTAVREHPELVREYMMTRAVTFSENRYSTAKPSRGEGGRHEGGGYGDTVGDLKFAALHGALFSGGTFLYVPSNVVIDLPLQALTYFDDPGLASFAHTLVILESGAAVKLIEDYASSAEGPQRISIGAVELILKPNASLQYFHLQDWARNVWHFSSQTAILERDSNLTWLAGTLGSGVTKAFLDCKLVGPGANVAMLGFFFGDEQQHFDQHTFQNHLHARTTSDLLYKGALKDKAYSAFRGLIRVNPGAQKADAYQQNRNLLLGGHAHADSIPELEIEANDVRCTHGATVGPIDQDQLFYLMARGIPQSEAERLIVEGFFDPLMQKIPLDSIRDRLAQVISAKIGA